MEILVVIGGLNKVTTTSPEVNLVILLVILLLIVNGLNPGVSEFGVV